jgi:hypothetical protein
MVGCFAARGRRSARWIIAAAALVSLAAPATAAVRISFLSRDFGTYYPHAFIQLTGTMDADPATPIDVNFGFTARSVSPAILMGPVRGEILSEGPAYIAGSERHFSMTLSDDQYRQVRALVEQWRDQPGRSYDLHRHNCVSFVKAVAELLGLRVEHADGLMMKPRSFLDEVALENPGAIDTSDAYVPKRDAAARAAEKHSSPQAAATPD